jgi:hypothetical protein
MASESKLTEELISFHKEICNKKFIKEKIEEIYGQGLINSYDVILVEDRHIQYVFEVSYNNTLLKISFKQKDINRWRIGTKYEDDDDVTDNIDFYGIGLLNGEWLLPFTSFDCDDSNHIYYDDYKFRISKITVDIDDTCHSEEKIKNSVYSYKVTCSDLTIDRNYFFVFRDNCLPAQLSFRVIDVKKKNIYDYEIEADIKCGTFTDRVNLKLEEFLREDECDEDKYDISLSTQLISKCVPEIIYANIMEEFCCIECYE